MKLLPWQSPPSPASCCCTFYPLKNKAVQICLPFPAWNTIHSLSGKTLEIYQEQWETFEEQGLELLRSRTDEATAAGVSTEFTQNSGNPGRTICDLARNWGSDLIVIGRRGHSGLSELILGSVSNYVLHHAPCSVLTVQGQVNPNLEAAQENQGAAVR